METPLVSICCIAYNHEKFIAKAIDGFLMQETSFSYEIIIHDDCSSDSTREIIEKYKIKYPNIIRTIYQQVNQYSRGTRIVSIIVPESRGKYVALCEGDDYWTDPLKLQKQVDFLEKNEDYSICFHNAKLTYEDNADYTLFVPNDINKSTFFIEDIIQRRLIPTASVVFRNILPKKFPNWFFQIPYGDTGLFILLTKNKSKLYYMNEVMSVYHKHSGGIMNTFNTDKYFEEVILFYKNLQIHLSSDYTSLFLERLSNAYYYRADLAYKNKYKKKAFLYICNSFKYLLKARKRFGINHLLMVFKILFL